MTKTEIILETVEYYNNNPRGSDNNSCFYFKEGKMCAVGRCLILPESFENQNLYTIGRVFNNTSSIMDSNLKKQYRGHSIDFWKDLQSFHDNPLYWEENESGNNLKPRGKFKLENLLELYGKS